MDYISANAVHGAQMRLPQCRILNLGLQGETAAQKVAVLAQSQSPLPLRCLRKKVHLTSSNLGQLLSTSTFKKDKKGSAILQVLQ